MTTLLGLMLATAAALTPLDETAYQKLVTANKGKVVVVNFWATWCAPCRSEMPQLVALGKRLAPKGVRLVVVSADEAGDAAQAAAFLDAQHAAPPNYIKNAANDEKFIDAIDPKWTGALPATFVYDRTGKRVKSFFGELPMADLEKTVGSLAP